MLSLQGFIAKELKQQGKLPEKFEDLSGAPKSNVVLCSSADGSIAKNSIAYISSNDGYYFRTKDGESLDWDSVPWEISAGFYSIDTSNEGTKSGVSLRYCPENPNAVGSAWGRGVMVLAAKAIYRTFKNSSTIHDLGKYQKEVNVYRYGKFSWDPETSKFTVGYKLQGDSEWTTAEFSKTSNPKTEPMIQGPSEQYAILNISHVALKYNGSYIYGKEL